MTRQRSWEPPDVPRLLISAGQVAAELEISAGKANELCWSLERHFYAPGGIHYRVSRRSFEAFKRLLHNGLTFYDAKSVMWEYKGNDDLPPDDLTPEDGVRIVLRQRQRDRLRDPTWGKVIGRDVPWHTDPRSRWGR